MTDFFNVSAGAHNASDPANWALSSGGAGGAGVPGPNDGAYFDANSLGACNWDIAQVDHFWHQSGYAQETTLSVDLVTRLVELKDGHLTASGYKITFDEWDQSGSTIFEQNSSAGSALRGFDRFNNQSGFNGNQYDSNDIVLGRQNSVFYYGNQDFRSRMDVIWDGPLLVVYTSRAYIDRHDTTTPDAEVTFTDNGSAQRITANNYNVLKSRANFINTAPGRLVLALRGTQSEYDNDWGLSKLECNAVTIQPGSEWVNINSFENFANNASPVANVNGIIRAVSVIAGNSGLPTRGGIIQGTGELHASGVMRVENDDGVRQMKIDLSLMQDVSMGALDVQADGEFIMMPGKDIDLTGTCKIAATAILNLNGATIRDNGVGSKTYTISQAVPLLDIAPPAGTTVFDALAGVTGALSVQGGAADFAAIDFTITSDQDQFNGPRSTLTGTGQITIAATGNIDVGGHAFGLLDLVFDSDTGAEEYSLTGIFDLTDFTLIDGVINVGLSAITVATFTQDGGTFNLQQGSITWQTHALAAAAVFNFNDGNVNHPDDFTNPAGATINGGGTLNAIGSAVQTVTLGGVAVAIGASKTGGSVAYTDAIVTARALAFNAADGDTYSVSLKSGVAHSADTLQARGAGSALITIRSDNPGVAQFDITLNKAVGSIDHTDIGDANIIGVEQPVDTSNGGVDGGNNDTTAGNRLIFGDYSITTLDPTLRGGLTLGLGLGL